ncbi:MAG: UbiA-like polyprenyltransferase [Candidatus Hydrothermarchaeales archaeon]
MERIQHVKIKTLFEMTKFERILLVLPFALMGAVLAAGGLPTKHQVMFILLALASARSGGMAINRFIDREIDALNLRTKDRFIPTGVLDPLEVLVFALISFALLAFAAYKLNPLCFKLSPFVILLICIYPYTKRFTSGLHILLGVILGLSPFGGWIAVSGRIEFPAIVLSLAVAFWMTGFDIIQDIRDMEFYRTQKLHSIPAWLGPDKSFWIAKGFAVASLLLFLSLYYILELGTAYLSGILIMGVLQIYQYHILSEFTDVWRKTFSVNVAISSLVFLFTFIDLYT